MKNNRIIKALRCQPVDKVPVWMMRQAGRYLPEYREVRQQAGSFIKLCQTPELACEVTLQPIRRYDMDAAILFADILTLPDAMGLGLEVIEKQGPVFQHTVRSQRDLDQLVIPNIEKSLDYVFAAIRLIKKGLADEIPLIGFAGSPWTVATYVVEGQGTKTFSAIKRMLYSEPQLLHSLLEKLTQATILYLKAQIAAGADVVMLFDSWGGVLAPNDYLNFSLAYMKKIVAAIKQEFAGEVPTILYGKQTHYALEQIAATGCNGIGLDWTIDIKEAKQRVANKVALQGNLDPAVLYAEPEQIRQQVNAILTKVGHQPGFIFNLGHGLMPDINPAHVGVAVETVKQFSV